MNRYDFEATSLCPNGALQDFYKCSVTSIGTIQVEAILAVVSEVRSKSMYQEQLADFLRNQLQARVEVVGWHYGVKVTCVRE